MLLVMDAFLSNDPILDCANARFLAIIQSIWAGLMAMLTISLYDKIRNVALNHEALLVSLSLFQLNKTTHPDLRLQSRATYMLTIEQLYVALKKKNNVTAILSHTHPLPQVKT